MGEKKRNFAIIKASNQLKLSATSLHVENEHKMYEVKQVFGNFSAIAKTFIES